MTIEYNVRATVWSEEYKKQIEITIGRFDKCSNALLLRRHTKSIIHLVHELLKNS